MLFCARALIALANFIKIRDIIMSKILIACEESQRICNEFRKLGHEAYSADIQGCSGGHPEWHIIGDVLPIINGNCNFTTMDGSNITIDRQWDLLIAHPPCTYLSVVANRNHSINCFSVEKINLRTIERINAMSFFMKFIMADCKHICVENPVGIMNTCYRKPDQIIHPYYFANSTSDIENYQKKKTCLWLKNLPILYPTSELPSPQPYFYYKSGEPANFVDAGGRIPGLEMHGSSDKLRSKTFPGIASAIAQQWSKIL